MYSICAIIITYNPDVDTIKRQYASLLGQVNQIVYVDNNSQDISVLKAALEKFTTSSCKVHIIYNAENMGLGYAQNQGINQAKKDKCTHVLILDHDSILLENFVCRLLEKEDKLLKAGQKVGAIGPVYYNEKTGEIYPITKYTGPFIKRIIPENEPVEASFLISSGCLIRLDVVNDVGLMNEDLFIDYIDVEWSFRARNKGYKLYADPNSRMSHTIGDKRTSVFGRTISVHSPIRRYYLYRNSIFMIRCSYISWGYKLRELTFNVLRFCVFMLLSSDRKTYFKYSLKGFRDGLKGKMGKYKD